MSEIKSPFLSEKKDVESKEAESISAKTLLDNESIKSEKTVELTDSQESESNANNDNDSKSDASLEIQEEGKTLRQIIIIMIILLALALMGLFAYNALNKKGEIPNNINMGQGDSLEITDFDMKGEEFQAKSIIIEEQLK
jgi:hypothetical protein